MFWWLAKRKNPADVAIFGPVIHLPESCELYEPTMGFSEDGTRCVSGDEVHYESLWSSRESYTAHYEQGCADLWNLAARYYS